MMDPRILTGPALLAAGGLLLFISGRLWLVHPVNRVFRVGPFVTPKGLEALLGLRMILCAFGLLIAESGVYRIAYWLFERDVNARAVVLLGSLETGLALWVAYLSIVAGVRIWRLH